MRNLEDELAFYYGLWLPILEPQKFVIFGLDTVDGLEPCQVHERKREEVAVRRRFLKLRNDQRKCFECFEPESWHRPFNGNNSARSLRRLMHSIERAAATLCFLQYKPPWQVEATRYLTTTGLEAKSSYPLQPSHVPKNGPEKPFQ